jgi:hypothetical protein
VTDSPPADEPVFQRRDWVARGLGRHDEFISGVPFPHVVIDNAIPVSVLDRVIDEFPEPEEVTWKTFNAATEVKLALADVEQMGPWTRRLLAEFNGQVFVDFLEALTGIDHLVPDPHYEGGGLHQIRRGGFLKVHADFNKHKRLKLDRRLNALLYLNKEWDASFGGNLELWDREMSTAVQSIPPVFNRMVVFATTDDALHGHPTALTCPPDRARRSMALYYYTNGRPVIEQSAAHTTRFRSRPGERLRVPSKERLKRWVPPAVVDLAKRART